MSDPVDLEAQARATVELNTEYSFPSSGGGGVPAEQIQQWDAETLDAAKAHAQGLVDAVELTPGADGWSVELGTTATHITVRHVRGELATDPVDLVSFTALTPTVSPAMLAQAVTDHLVEHPLRWGDVAERPEVFPPEAHGHTIDDVDGLDVALAGKSPLGHTHDAASLVGLNAGLVGLGNVDNTRDANKPVSTAQAAEIAKKANTSHQHSAADTTSGVFVPARLGSGTAGAGKVLYGDGSWKDAPTGGAAAPQVTYSTGSLVTTVDYPRNTFVAVQYSIAPTANIGGGTWNGTSIWTVPVTGTYLLVGSIRFADGASPIEFSTGIHTTTADGSHGLWAYSPTGNTRPMAQYTRIVRLTAGTGIMQYLYQSTGGTIRLKSDGQGCSWSATLLSTG